MMRYLKPIALIGMLAISCAGDGTTGHPDAREALEELRAEAVAEVVARVNGKDLGRAELLAYWQDHRHLDALQALEGLVARELLVQEALKGAGEGDLAQGRAEMNFARKQAMVRALLEQQVEAEVSAEGLTDEEITRVETALRDQGSKSEGVRASHILVQVPSERPGEGRDRGISEADRQGLYEQARPFIEAIAKSLNSAEQVSIDDLFEAQTRFTPEVPEPFGVDVNAHLSFPIESIKEGQTLPEGWIQVVPAFSAAAAQLARSGNGPALSEPVQSDFGWHLILFEESFDARVPEPLGLRELARQEALRLKRAERVQELLVAWIEESKIFLHPEVIARQGKLHRD